jgi:thiol-disulfide isomerase/thioredoxin
MEGPLAKVAQLLSYIKYKGFTDTFKTMSEIDAFAKETDQLVWIYANWCGPCKNAKKDWQTTREFINMNNIKLKMQSIDGSVHQDVAKAFKITGYPYFAIVKMKAANDKTLKIETVDCRDSNFLQKIKKEYSSS